MTTSGGFDQLALGAMVSRCGWNPLEVVNGRTVILDSDGSGLLTLPSLHVTDVSSVVVTNSDGTTTMLPVGPGSSADLPSWLNGYVAWSEDGTIEWSGYGCALPAGRRNVAVTYSGGYSEAPDDLVAALNSLGKRTGGGLSGAGTAKMGTAVLTLGAAVAAGGTLVTEQMVFDRYRIVQVR